MDNDKPKSDSSDAIIVDHANNAKDGLRMTAGRRIRLAKAKRRYEEILQASVPLPPDVDAEAFRQSVKIDIANIYAVDVELLENLRWEPMDAPPESIGWDFEDEELARMWNDTGGNRIVAYTQAEILADEVSRALMSQPSINDIPAHMIFASGAEEALHLSARDRRYVLPLETQDTTDLDDVLTERRNRYGAFSGVSRLSQSMKKVMQSSDNWDDMTDDQREGLDMVVHKIARIPNGDPDYLDSWEDMIGYINRVNQSIKGEEN